MAGEVEFAHQGNVIGCHRYTGQFFLTSLVTSSPVGGVVAFKASLVSDEAVIKETVT